VRPAPPLRQHTGGAPGRGKVPHPEDRPRRHRNGHSRRGYRWEERILDQFLAGKVIVGTAGEPDAPVHETRHDAAGTIAALLGASDGQAVYQAAPGRDDPARPSMVGYSPCSSRR
jgi:hypothetical protein